MTGKEEELPQNSPATQPERFQAPSTNSSASIGGSVNGQGIKVHEDAVRVHTERPRHGLDAHGEERQPTPGSQAHQVNGGGDTFRTSFSKETNGIDRAMDTPPTDPARPVPVPGATVKETLGHSTARRLEVAVNDPVLGSVEVRAEWKGGAIHASLSAVDVASRVSSPGLQHFLREQNIPVETVTYRSPPSETIAGSHAAGTNLSQGSERQEAQRQSAAQRNSLQASPVDEDPQLVAHATAIPVSRTQRAESLISIRI